MLIQDLNLTAKFKDIQLEDILLGNIQNRVDVEEGEKWEEFKILEETREKDPEIDDLSGMSDNGDETDKSDFEEEEENAKKKKVKSKRVRWTSDEIEEIRKYFKENLRTKTCPSKQDCLKAIGKSKKNRRKAGT